MLSCPELRAPSLNPNFLLSVELQWFSPSSYDLYQILTALTQRSSRNPNPNFACLKNSRSNFEQGLIWREVLEFLDGMPLRRRGQRRGGYRALSGSNNVISRRSITPGGKDMKRMISACTRYASVEHFPDHYRKARQCFPLFRLRKESKCFMYV